jgi:hypothetical protein
MLIVMERLQQVDIFNLHMQRHGTFLITQQQKPHDSCDVPSARFNVQFCLLHGLQPAGIMQLVTQITFCFSTCNPRTGSPQ